MGRAARSGAAGEVGAGGKARPAAVCEGTARALKAPLSSAVVLRGGSPLFRGFGYPPHPQKNKKNHYASVNCLCLKEQI